MIKGEAKSKVFFVTERVVIDEKGILSTALGRTINLCPCF